MLLGHVRHVAEPVVDQPVSRASEGGGHAAAAVVPADDHVADAQDVHGVLDDREAVEVGVDDDVGDVAVHEDLARQEVDDLVRRDAAVGAADPEELGRLVAGELGEERGVGGNRRLRPRAVAFEQLVETGHRGRLASGGVGQGDSASGSAGRTSKLNIIPLSWCSAMWQCAIQRPGFVTSSRMSTVSPVRKSTVSFQT